MKNSMSNIFRVILVGFAILSSSYAYATAERKYDLNGFNGIKVESALNVIVEIGDVFSVRASSAKKSHLDKLKVSVENGILMLKRKCHMRDCSNKVVFNVTMPKIESINASSASDVNVSDLNNPQLKIYASSASNVDVSGINCQQLKINASSAADIYVSGHCLSLDVDASSAADINARKLSVETAEVHASSSADVRLKVTQSFIGNASSAADINVFGHPKNVKKKTSSSADINIKS